MDANKTDRTIMTKYAVIPKGTDMSEIANLTIGKRYEILKYKKYASVHNIFFSIIDDDGDLIRCPQKACAYLNDQNWEIQ
jgi:hypothetical protein